MADQVSVTKEIEASPDVVWQMVSDLPRMGEWSPENESSVWLGGATRAAPGAKFKGENRNGKKKWSTMGEIVDAEPARLLSFRIKAAGFKVAEWRYDFEATDTGCLVTETWIDQRGRIAKTFSRPASGVSERHEHNRAGMEETLERLKQAAEATSPGS